MDIAALLIKVSELIITVQFYLEHLTLMQVSIIAGVVGFIVGVLFFSDGFNNKQNAFSFAFSYIVLCLFFLLGYHLVNTFVLPTN